MKNIILLSFLFFVSLSLKAQSGFEMKGYFGISGTSIARKVNLEGITEAEMTNLKEVGLLFSKGISKKVTITTGLNFGYGEVEFRPAICPNCSQQLTYYHNSNFEIISIPVYGSYSFWNFLYVTAGPIIDFQLSEGNNFSDQSGLGYLAGLGARFDSKKVSFSIFPNYKRHGAIPFDDSAEYKHILQELGVQFGVGYRF
jgi:hypothetical protein